MKPKIICLTPVKNEAWILRMFLKSVSLWADHIIIADQGSTDGSIEIAKSFPKVTLIHNSSKEFNEETRQKLLLEEGRKIEGPRLFIALDADELISANYMNSSEWEQLQFVEPGTVIQFRLINLRPDMKTCWSPDYNFNIGYMDDGASHSGNVIHTSRVPVNNQKKSILLKDIKLLHYQFTDWDRMKSKHRWYQCFELVSGEKHPVSIYRQYHHMYSIPPKELFPACEEWFEGYEKKGIKVRVVHKEGTYYWDRLVEDYLSQYGTKYFQSLNLWEDQFSATDSRGPLWKGIHHYLKKTQPISHWMGIRGMDFILKRLVKR